MASQPLCGITSRIANRSAHDVAAQNPIAKPMPTKRPHARTVIFEAPQERERRLDAKVGLDTREIYENMRKRETWVYNPDAAYLKVRASERGRARARRSLSATVCHRRASLARARSAACSHTARLLASARALAVPTIFRRLDYGADRGVHAARVDGAHRDDVF